MNFGMDLTPTLPATGAYYKLLSALQLIPFHWNQKFGVMSHKPRLLRLYWFFMCPVLIFAHIVGALMVFLKSLHSISHNNGWQDVMQLFGFTLSLILVIANTGFFTYALIFWWKYEDLIKFYNESVRYRIKLKEIGGKVRNDNVTFKPLVLLLFLRIYSNISLCISHPEKPLFLYWAIPDDWKTPVVHKMYVIVNAVYASTYWAIVPLLLTTMFLYVDTIHAALRFRNSLETTRTLEELKFYRELMLLARLFETAFGKDGLPLYFSSITALLILATYGVVRFCGRVIFKLYIGFLSPFLAVNTIYAHILITAAKMKEESQEMRRRIHERMDNRSQYGRAVLRSFPDLGLRVSNFYVIERKAHLAVLGFVIINAVTLLITL